VKAVVVSGLWPPDVGGPASHAPEVCDWLFQHGHDVTVVTFADRAPRPRPYPVHWVSRRLPPGARHLHAASLVARLGRKADVVYSIAMLGRTSAAATLAGTPHVIKLTTDPVFERSLHWRLTDADLAAFQRRTGVVIGALRRVRDTALAHASRVLLASRALHDLALSWGVPEEKTELLPNPIAAPERLPAGDAVRQRLGVEGPLVVYAGRLVPQKSVDIALDAVRWNPEATVLVAGEGPEREALERYARGIGLDGHARFIGPQPRETVFELLRAADAAILSSSWENFPHVAVESLSVGTPVIATAAGGVPEIVRDDWNGLLVPVGDGEALGGALGRYLDDDALRERLRGNAAGSVADYAPERVLLRLEHVLEEAAAR
jgi:glycosyltransferase involved in cell wall biosynthesis